MKKYLVFLMIAALAAVLAVGLAACGGGGSSSSSESTTSESKEEGGGGASPTAEGNNGGTMKIAYTNFPDYVDPQISYTAQGWTSMRNVYTPMIAFAPGELEEGSEIIPALAKELPKVTNGGKTYTMFMKKGLKYSNGEEIKAGDFKWAIERTFLTNSGGSPFYTTIVGAEKFAKTKKGEIPGIKVNEKTGEVKIEVVAPQSTFEDELALPFAAPIPQKTPAEDQSAHPIPGSGPYMITKAEPGRGITYERNPYWASTNQKQMTAFPAGHADKIELQVLRNQSTQVNELEAGNINYVFDPPPADRYQEVKEKYEGTQFKEVPTTSTYYFWMNQEIEPFNNKMVREAINYAVDPAALERIYVGTIEPTQQVLPPGLPGYKKYELYPHSMKKAEELIAKSGVSQEKTITVWTDSTSPNNEAGTYYANLLQELGFKTELKIINADNYFTVLGNENTPNLDTGWVDWFADYPHPNDFFDILLNGNSIQSTNNQNFSRSNYKPLNEKIEKLATEQLGPKQEKEYAELDEEFMKEAPWAPYGTRTQDIFVSSNVNLENVIWNPNYETEFTSLEFTE